MNAQKRWRQKHPERAKQSVLRWRQSNPDKHALAVFKTNLKRNYGLTLDDYNAKLLAQNNKCDCCGDPFRTKICVDHNHVTGQIRGLICMNCNFMLGHAGENTERLLRGGMYLRRWAV